MASVPLRPASRLRCKIFIIHSNHSNITCFLHNNSQPARRVCRSRVPLTGILCLATLTLEARLKTYIYCTYSGRTDSGRTARFENLSPHPGPDHTELTAQMLRTFRSDSVCLGETLSDPTEHTAQMLKNETIQDQVPISSPPPPLYLSAITCQYTCFLQAASGPVVKYCKAIMALPREACRQHPPPVGHLCACARTCSR